MNNKSHILIGSVSRTQNDHRVYEKWGLFFKRTYPEHKVRIFAKKNTESPDDYFDFTHSLKKGRLLAPVNFLKLLFRTKPRLIVCTTFELLLPSIVFKITHLNSTKIVYDVIENYRLNILFQKRFNKTTKRVFSTSISIIEWISRPFIDFFFYSDVIYKTQLTFLNENASYIPNYYSYSEIPKLEQTENFTCLLTGTLSSDYGLERGIDWFNEIKKHNPNAELKILGQLHGSLPSELDSSATLNTSNDWISHKEILNAIAQSDLVLMPYEWTESFYGCIPSKIYECLTIGTPFIITKSNHLDAFSELNGVHPITNKNEIQNLKLNTKLEPSTEFHFTSYYNSMREIINTLIIDN